MLFERVTLAALFLVALLIVLEIPQVQAMFANASDMQPLCATSFVMAEPH